MATIYTKCTFCHEGKLAQYPQSSKITTAIYSLALATPAVFFLHAITQIIAIKLKNQPIPVKSFPAIEAAVSAAIFLLIGAFAHYDYRILNQIKAWMTKDCPHCQDGYLIKDRVSLWQAIVYFFDIFLFEQILIPMYQALTFQFVWASGTTGTKPSKTVIIFKILCYFFLFFGSIPFLVLLLGQNKLAGLLFAFTVMLYIVSMIFSGNEEERSYQRSIIFLLIPLYYVSMVEIFRWAWVFSSDALTVIPDQSDFLLMGLENLIRTQLFMDLFEVYDLRVGDVEAASFISYSAIFVTRLLLDVALISMLIGIAIKSYRRAWVFKFTGRKSEEVTESEVLVNMENLAAIGNPKDIGRLREELNKVVVVLRKLRPYVTGVTAIAEQPDTKAAAEECAAVVANVTPAEEAATAPRVPAMPFSTRMFAVACVAIWVVAFTIGIRMFIADVTRREIQDLMAMAQKPAFQNNPLSRQQLYAKVLKKDQNYSPALLASARTYLEMAGLHANLFDFDQSLIDIDKGFQQTMRLEKIIGLGKPELLATAGDAYAVRGKLFFLQGDLDRAINELEKQKTPETARLMFVIRCYRACQAFATPEFRQRLELADQAREVGNPDAEGQMALLHALAAAKDRKLAVMIEELQYACNPQRVTSAPLRAAFADLLAQSLTCQGKDYFDLARQQLSQARESDSRNYQATWSLANLCRLENKHAAALTLLTPLVSAAAITPAAKAQTYLVMAITALEQNQRQNALDYLTKALEPHQIREHLRQALLEFWSGPDDAEALHSQAQSWNLELAQLQKSLVFFYSGVRHMVQGKTGPAAEAFRQCIALGQTDTAEYRQARQEFVNLQITAEGTAYNLDLWLDDTYLAALNQMVQIEVRNRIYREQDTVAALSFLLGTIYDKEKERALNALQRQKAFSSEQFVPPLKLALQDSSDEVKLAALQGFVALGAPAKQAIGDIIVCLQNEDERVRRGAVKVMAILGRDGLEPLKKALADQDKYVRRDAAYALANLGDEAKSALPALEQRLGDAEVMVRDAVFTAVKAMKPEAGEVLARFIAKGSDDSPLLLRAIQELDARHQAEFVKVKAQVAPLLVKILTTDNDPQSRRFAAGRLLMLDAEDSLLTPVRESLLSRMQENLQDPDAKRRIFAARLYLKCHERWGVDPQPAQAIFFALWAKYDARNRARLVDELVSQEVLSPGIIVLLGAALSHQQPEVQTIGNEVLDKLIHSDPFATLAKHLIEQLTKVLLSKNEAAMATAEKLLMACPQANGAVAVPLLLPYLIHEEALVRNAVANALMQEGIEYTLNDTELELLVTWLEKQPQAQGVLLKVAYNFKLKTPKLFELCEQMLEAEDLTLRVAAIKAISFFPDHKQTIVPKLLAMLKNPAKPQDGDESEENPYQKVKQAALLALGALDGIENFHKLCPKDPELQAMAIGTIREIQKHLAAEDSAVVASFLSFMAMAKGDSNVIGAALSELLEIKEGREQALPVLAKLEQSKTPEISHAARKVLLDATPGKYDAKLLGSWLAQDDEATDLETRLLILDALAALQQKASPAVSEIAKGLLHDTPDVRQKSGQILASLGKSAMPMLMQLVDAKEAQTKVAALRVLSQMEASYVRPVLALLLDKLDNAVPQVSEAILPVVYKVAKLEDRRAVMPVLQKVVQHPTSTEKVKISAWLTVANLGQQNLAIPELFKLLEETKEHHSFIVAELHRIAPAPTVKYLTQAIQQRYGKLNILVAMQLLEQVEPYNNRQAIAVLEEVGEDPNPEVRAVSRTVLQKLRK